MNLAGSSWWPFGAAARQRYRRWRREWSTEPGGTAPRPDTGFLQYERLLVTTALERSGGDGVGDDTSVMFVALMVDTTMAMLELHSSSAGRLRGVDHRGLGGNVRCRTCQDALYLTALRTGEEEAYCLECALRGHCGGLAGSRSGTLVLHHRFREIRAHALVVLGDLDQVPRGARAAAGLSGRGAALAEARGHGSGQVLSREVVVGDLLGRRAVLAAALPW